MALNHLESTTAASTIEKLLGLEMNFKTVLYRARDTAVKRQITTHFTLQENT